MKHPFLPKRWTEPLMRGVGNTETFLKESTNVGYVTTADLHQQNITTPKNFFIFSKKTHNSMI